MTTRQLKILQHSIGVDQYGRIPRGWDHFTRNFFCAGDGCDTDPDCNALVSLGFMGIYPKRGDCTDYFVTEAGKKAVADQSPNPPKRTKGQERYREWLNVSDVFPDWTFGDWLKNRVKLKESER